MGKQKKIIISVAIIGAIHTPGMSPYLPKTPDEIIEQAVEAHKEGAEGMTTQERFAIIEVFQPEMASLNAFSMNFCFNRLAKLLDHPQYDWELPFVERTYDNVFKNTFLDMQYCLETMNACGTLPEYEVFDYGQLANLAYFKKEGMIKQPIYIQFVPGVMGAMPMTGESMLFMIDQAKNCWEKIFSIVPSAAEEKCFVMKQ